ncbi:MAG: Two-component system response regulator [Mycobacterium sp.]|nr:Two-component system response regulator [Mycobacterium sp.]
MAVMNVVLVEDDDAISGPLARGLRREGYEVELRMDGPSGLEAGLNTQVSLVILDVGLPRLDGLEVCRQLRAARPRLQILLLTALSEEVHAVDGLDAGADDYITKPFRLAELLARVRAAGRRALPQELNSSGVRVDTGSRRAFVDDSELTLSPKEFDLLARLMADPGQVVTREQLLRDVWQTSWHGSGRTLDQHVSWLRAKVGDGLIITARGKGFRFRGEDG